VTVALDAQLAGAPHREVHERFVAAAPEAVWRALREVSADELVVTRPLMALRGLPVRGRRGRSRPRGRPFVDAFLAQGFGLLAEEEDRVLVAGGIGRPWRLNGGESAAFTGADEFAAFAEPGWVRMALSFELAPEGAGTRLRTETRVAPTDAGAARAFARYWRVIRLPSGLIRHDLLRAIARRAEGGR
jgi:hypothetical protein